MANGEVELHGQAAESGEDARSSSGTPPFQIKKAFDGSHSTIILLFCYFYLDQIEHILCAKLVCTYVHTTEGA